MNSTKFYTCVEQIHGKLYVREIVDGVHSISKVKYKPQVYLADNSDNDEGYTNHQGQKLTRLELNSISEARDFNKKYKDIDNFEVYGQLNWVLQYLQDYPMSGWDFNQLRVFSIDIETAAAPDGGFPTPEKAEGEILLITLHDFTSRRLFTFGSKPYSGNDTNYTYCVNEDNLIKQFMLFWQQFTPNIVTGWNSDTKGFDLMYLVHRINNKFGKDYVNQLSPFGLVDIEYRDYKGKQECNIDIKGVSSLDLMLLMKKFTFTPRESWALGAVSQEELGTTKLENPTDTFQDFYTNHWDTFVKYNIKDTELVTALNDKMHLVELACTMAYKAKINYTDVFSPVKMWDSILSNTMYKNKVIVPQRKHTGADIGESIMGGYVKEPVPGFYKDIVSLDATSLYPSIMRLLNLGFDTIVGRDLNVTLDKLLTGNITVNCGNNTMAANGVMFRKDKIGVIPGIVIGWMKDRKKIKSEMLRLEQERETLYQELKLLE